jgi:hypothetical protein
MTNCPCCAHQLLRHIRGRNLYLFCCHCRQEMPTLEMKSYASSTVFKLTTEVSNLHLHCQIRTIANNIGPKSFFPLC